MATGRSSLGKPEEEHGDKLSQAEIDRREAIATLVDIGLLIPVRKMDLYHGRAGDGKNEWRVDPAFNNGSNATGNKNVNKRSALNTGNLEVANRFASARTRWGKRTPEVHKIEAMDKDAMQLFNLDRVDTEAEAKRKKERINKKAGGGQPTACAKRWAYDEALAKDFLSKIDTGDRTRDLVVGMIGRGHDLTT